MKIGDLVKLRPELGRALWGTGVNLGLIVEIIDITEPKTMSVIWNGDPSAHVEYEDGLIVVSGGK